VEATQETTPYLPVDRRSSICASDRACVDVPDRAIGAISILESFAVTRVGVAQSDDEDVGVRRDLQNEELPLWMQSR
jgi:hypothetical protein